MFRLFVTSQGEKAVAILAIPVSITADAVSQAEGNAGFTQFTFTVMRGLQSGLTDKTTVDYAVAANGVNAADFGGTLPSGTVTFSMGEIVKTITIQVASDNIVEANEMFTVTLSNPSVGSEITTGSASSTIANDDQVIGTAGGPGQEPRVRVFQAVTGEELFSFLAYDAAFLGGIRVAASDVNDDGQADILAATGPGGGPHVRVFDGASMGMDPEELRSVLVSDPNFTGGVFVAGGTELASDLPAMLLRLADGFDSIVETSSLTHAEIQPIFETALNRLKALGASDEILNGLATLTLQVADLEGDILAQALPGSIVFDINAASVGWFIDPTPTTDEEFAAGNAIDPNAQGRIDLLTVILHELGHHLGGQDLDIENHPQHFRAETLAPSQRRLPKSEDLDLLFADADLLESMLG